MAQLFSNNVDTQLSAPLSDVATSATLADGSGLNTPTGGDFELLTLISGTTVEVVRMTARTGNTITITRAQEGTVALAWGTGARVFAGVTAGTLAALLSNAVGDAATDSIAPGRAWSAGNEAAVLGVDAGTVKQRSVAVGSNAYTEGDDSLAVGAYSYTLDVLRATAVGFTSYVAKAYGCAIGAVAHAEGEDSISIGSHAETHGDHSIAVGSYPNASGNESVAIGRGAATAAAHIAVLTALHTVPSGNPDATDVAWKKSAAGTVILSRAVDLKTLQTIDIPIPSGVLFFPDEVGVIVTAANTVSGQPTLRYGITGAETQYLAATETVGLAAVGARHRFTTLASAVGATNLRAEVTIAATGTTLTGRVYWRGFAVES